MTFYQRFTGHLKTINTHRREVRKLMACCGLDKQGRRHDLSKYSFVEFFNGVKYFTGTTSPHVGERKDKGYSEAWLNHKAHNKHHAEYWTDIVDGKSQPIDMPINYFVEMVCDRIAASKTYLGHQFTKSAPFDYYMSHQDESQFSDNTRTLLYVALVRYQRFSDAMFFDWIKELLADPTKAYQFNAFSE
jgi:hypothetical protein